MARVSTLAPVFAAAFATPQQPRRMSCGLGRQRLEQNFNGVRRAVSDDGSLTGQRQTFGFVESYAVLMTTARPTTKNGGVAVVSAKAARKKWGKG